MSNSYPNIKNKVFSSTNYQSVAHIPKSCEGDHSELLDRYYNGFRELADIAVQQILESNSGVAIKDRLVFPIIYNYRHFLELILKKYAIKYNKSEVDLNNLGHNLKFYWDIVKPIILKTYARISNINEVINATESYILEFHDLDKSSMRFRYPFTKGEILAPNFPEGMSIDLINLKQRMGELYNFLEYLEDNINRNEGL